MTAPAHASAGVVSVARVVDGARWLVAGVLYALGWSAAVVVLVVLWSVAAVRVGWADARKRR